ncbi:hypothetical protein HOU08_gp010 [Dickeya phage vB_DsoM_JA29]|uniref:Uncharacterized protein n=1 Tax=Dickeya phage vB_DsoM_JA29 TaxID=2283031 RepID=A0A384ZWX4_9CAUD|nr:hypothetical protein HOU08_gp010 [Dickeya phage vB_DsoM_JA29]AXG66736.1 hypothetical protein JA29_010 [Dickeya phage vB_DsoM_JA29]
MDVQTRLANFIESYHSAFQSDDCEAVDIRLVNVVRTVQGKDPEIIPKDLFNSFLFQIAYKRFYEHAQTKLDLSLIVLAACISSLPGEVVMLCSYCYLKGISNFDEFALDVGFDSCPSDFSAAWDAQKVEGANALDMLSEVEAYRTKQLG